MDKRRPHHFCLAELVRGADRLPLARFWLACPCEALASLWQSEVGEVSRHLITNPYPRSGGATAGHLRLAAALQRRIAESNDENHTEDSTAVFISLLVLACDHPSTLQISPVVQNWLQSWWQPKRSQLLQHQRDLDDWENGQSIPLSLEALGDQISRCNSIRRRANLLLIQPNDEATADSLRLDRLLLVRLLGDSSEQQLQSLISRPGSRFPVLYRSMLHCGLRDRPLLAEDQDQLQGLLPPSVLAKAIHIEPPLDQWLAEETLTLPLLLAQLLLLPCDAGQRTVEKASIPLWFAPWADHLLEAPPSLRRATATSVDQAHTPLAGEAAVASPALSVDLGCGSTPRNPFKATRVIGVDAVIQAENVLNQWVGFQNVSLADSSVDVVTAFDFLQLLPRFLLADGQVHNPFVRALNDIWRILRPGGVFYAETPAHPHAIAYANPANLNVICEDTVQYFARLLAVENDHPATQAYDLGRRQGFQGHFHLLDQHWEGPRLCWTLRCEKH